MPTENPPLLTDSKAILNDSSPIPPTRRVPVAEIEAAVRAIRYGVVQIIIQDGVVVQIDKTEKLRLTK